MESLTAYGYGAHVAFVLLSCLILIAESGALFRSASLLGRQRAYRILPELAALSVLLSIALLFGGSWSLFLTGFIPGSWMMFVLSITRGESGSVV